MSAPTASLPDERRVPAGAIIFQQGDSGAEMFVIGTGRVRLTIASSDGLEHEIGVFGQGDFFGELSLLGGAMRSATATAIEESTLLVVTRDVFAMMVQDDLEIVFRMMAAQSQRLSATNIPIQQLTQRLGRVRVAAHCLRRAVGGQLPVTFEAAALATELGLPVAAVSATFEDVRKHDAGVFDDGRWTLRDAADLQRLAAAIADIAD